MVRRLLAACLLLAAAAGVARAAAVTWTGAAVGDWNNAASWSGAAVPGAADDVSIVAATVIAYATAPAPSVKTLSLGSGALLYTQTGLTTAGAATLHLASALQLGATAPLSFGSLVLQTGSSVTYVAPPVATGTVPPLVLNAGVLTVQAGSTLTVAGRGYAGGGLTLSGAGPGGGGAGVGLVGGGGAGHLGLGGDGGGASNHGVTYDAGIPASAGSGGGGTASAPGGAGGGLLRVVAGTATIDGFLSADGEPGVPLGAYGGGGGAGGTVLLQAQYLYGAGRLSAKGATGGAGGSRGGGGGGGGSVWISEGSGYRVVGSTLTLTVFGAFGGAGTIGGQSGGDGALYQDPRHWTGATGAAASNGANWGGGLAPSGGERLVFGSSTSVQACSWDLPSVAVGSVTVLGAYQATVTLTSSMSVSGTFDMEGGTVTASAAMALGVGGALSQTGGRLDVGGGTLTIAGMGTSSVASFYDAKTGLLSVGGAGAATATVSGFLEVVGLAQLAPGGTLSLSTGVLRFDGNGPFAGAGSVNASTASTVYAGGSSTQTWTGWPGALGHLRSGNGSLGGLVLSVGSGPFVLAGNVSVDTATILTMRGSRLEVGGDWAAYGSVLPAGSTVAFRAASGVQRVLAGAYFDNLVVDDAGATLRFSTWVVVGSSVGVYSGTLDLASSTVSVRGNWTETPGATVLGGTSVAAFDGVPPQSVYQIGGNSFGAFFSSSGAQVVISSALATAANFEWHRGNLLFPGASLKVGGDMLVKGGILLTVNGSTVVFTGSASTQVVNFSVLGSMVDANTGANGLFLGTNIRCENFRVLPGAVLNGGSSVLTVTGSSFDTASSTYYATTPGHQVLLQPVASVTVGAGSLVNGTVIVDVGKTAVLNGDLNLTGVGTSLDPHLGATVVIPVGGSTIAFRGNSDFKPTAGANWTFGGDVGRSWLVFEGTGTKGASISTNTFGAIRVTLQTASDTFKVPSLNLLGGFYQENGIVSPIGSPTLRVTGDLLQNGGTFDWAGNSTGTVRFVGGGAQTVRMRPGFHSFYHLTDNSTGTVTAASDLLVRGDFVVQAGTLSATAGNLRLQQRVLVSTVAVFAGAGSTVTLDGATVGVATQNLGFYGGGSFGGLAFNVGNAVLQTGATAQVLTAAVPGGTLTLPASAQLTVYDLRLGSATTPNLIVRSAVAGSPWFLDLLGVSSVTATTVSDSNASPGRTVNADDGRSTDGGGNSNWSFRPGLLVLLPGETFTPGVAPGKTGSPTVTTAGAPFSVGVFAVSSHYDVASATGVVTLTSDDAFASVGSSRPLVNGSTVFVVTPFAAEPNPRSTHFVATTFFGTGLSTATVIPSALARLQIVMPGEAPLPGSPGGRSGSPFPRVKGVPFTATVRAVDSYWNAVTTITHSYALGTAASSATLPGQPALAAGVGTATGLIFYTTGLFTFSATDLTQPNVLAATSAVFGVAPPSVSSPSAAFYVPTGASIATLGGMIAGTASDSSSIALVRVDILEIETGLHYDGVAAFVSAAPVYTTSTLAAPLSPSTSWAAPVPDSALTSGRHYAATALVDDPSGFSGVAASTFVVDRTALLYGSASGQGAVTARPASAPGCEVMTATLTFTAGAAGVAPGGAVAVRAPEGWTLPQGVTGTRPPPAGFWNYLTTSAASASLSAAVAPAGFAGQPLGPGWLLVSVPTSAPAGLRPGEQVSFQYTGLPPLTSAGRGAQTFGFWTTADATGPLAPVSSQPAVVLTAGTTSALAFVDPTPLYLGPLQTSTTMQLKVVDLCGNEKLGASSGTATVGLVIPANGAFVPDALATFRLANGVSVSTVVLSTGVSYSQAFTVQTATSGPTTAFVRATAFFPAVSTSVVVTAMRPVSLAPSGATFGAVWVDTGTDSPGNKAASFSTATPDAYPVRLVFSVPDPALSWDATLSTDAVNFWPPVFSASGQGDATKPIVLTWDGADRVSGNPARAAPPGLYRLRLRAGGGMVSDTSASVWVPRSAGYVGVLGAAGAGATVRAQGPGAGDDSFTTATSTGYFSLIGLRAGQAYRLDVATLSSVGGVAAPVTLSVSAPAATIPSADLGAVAMPSPARVRVSAVLPVPAPSDAVGSFVGRAADGSAAFAGALRFSTGAASSDDGGPLFGRAASTWSAAAAVPGVYTLELSVPDLRLSTAIPNVTLTAAGADLVVPFSRTAGAAGWAVLPSTVAGGVTVTVQAARAGDSAPSVFGAVFVSSVPPAVGASSGAYALYGLDPGTWTLTATAPGFLPSSASVLIAGSADVAVPPIALGAGGAVAGGLVVSGDSTGQTQCFPGPAGAAGSCPAGTFDVAVEALAVGTLDRGAATARLAASASSSSATFRITGLAPGVWRLNASLPGFVLSPSTGALVTVTGASVSTAAFSLVRADARARVVVNLPPLAPGSCRAPSSYAGLGVAFDGADGVSRVYGDATTVSGGGAYATFGCSSATVFSPALPPGPVRAAAAYGPGGQWGFARASLSGGATATLTLDLTASSVPVSGFLTVAGPILISTNPGGAPRFTVAASSVAGIQGSAAGVSLCLLGSKDPLPRSALRAEFLPYDPAAALPAVRRSTGTPGSCAAPAPSTAAATGLAFVGGFAVDGTLSMNSGLQPGTYLLRVPGELDDDPGDGAEAPDYAALVTVGASGATVAPRLGRGARVSGALTAPASLPAGRRFRVSLLGAGGVEVRGAEAAPAPGGSAAFAFDGVPDGVYALSIADLAAPRAWAAASLAVTVAGADVSGLAPALTAAGVIRARLAAVRLLPDGTEQAVLVTRDNAGLLPPGFSAVAAANPSAAGAVYPLRPAPDGSLTDAQGRLVFDGLMPGTYDVSFAGPNDPAALGAGSLALSPARVSAVSVAPGQAVDLGVVPLFAGSFVTGAVTDAATGRPVSGLTVAARPSAAAGAAPGAFASSLFATTDDQGRYLLRGLDPAFSRYDVTAAPRGPLVTGAALPPYAARRVLSVDVTSGAVVDLALSPAAAVVTGRVVPFGSAPLTASLGPGDDPAPGAVVTLQNGAVTPAEDPLSDLAVRTNPDGSFSIPSVATGTYRLTAAAVGMGSAARTVVVTTAAVDLGAVALGSGAGMSGALRLPDGSAPTLAEVAALAAVTGDSSEFLYAAVSADPTGRFASGYSVSGLTPGRAYKLVVSGPGGAAYVPPEAASVVLTSTSAPRVLDLTLRPPAGPVSFRATRSGTRWTVAASFARPVRARYASDSDPAVLLTTASATGALSGQTLSADRLSVAAVYDPGPGETSAVFRASGALTATDWGSTTSAARELTVAATTVLSLAGDGQTRQPLTNGLGGALTLDGDAGRVVLPRGAFAVDAATTVPVTLTRSAAPAAFAAAAPPVPAAGPFYDVSLPAGTPAALARPATLTLAYSTAVADPSRLNVYWWNPAAGRYILQPDALGAPLTVDGSARTVTLRVAHFSTYVLLDSAAGAIGGSAFTGGDLDAYNFPNPFDLKVKTVTTIHGGGAPAVRGTLVRVAVPPGVSGAGTLKVFDVTGRLVRTVDLGMLSAGQTYYQVWDGTNDSGADVASGLYLAVVEVGGRRKTFKMAVLK